MSTEARLATRLRSLERSAALDAGPHPLVERSRPLAPAGWAAWVARRVDPGWLFLTAGVALLSVTMLIPAIDGLSRAEHERDAARALAAWHAERLSRYSAFADELASGEPEVLRSLVARELNLVPTGAEPIAVADAPGADPVSVFDRLDPPFTMPLAPRVHESRLGEWARHPRSRLWLLAGGVLLVLMGLVTGGRESARRERLRRAGQDADDERAAWAGVARTADGDRVGGERRANHAGSRRGLFR
jgi:hypothetical protein